MMPRMIRMPSTSQLPPGPRRDFVEELFGSYRAAGRPTLAEISDRLAERDELTGTASRETVRRMLRGTTVPKWATVEAVFLVLCEFAGRDPDEHMEGSSISPSYREMLESVWNNALDADPASGPPPTVWALTDEPPF